MKKKYIVIILILAVLAVAVTVGINVRNNKKSNQAEQSKDDKEIVIGVPKEDENESSEKQGEDVPAESPQETPTVTFDDSTAVTVWTISNLNLREQPNGNSTVITVISKGTEMKKGTEENGWVQVKVGDTIGFVSAQYISDTKPEEKPVVPQQTTSKVEAIPGQRRDPNNIVVVIDPGHQLRGDNNKEPNGPGSTSMKARVTSGTTGVATGVAEYVLNLDISMKLKLELENRGYVVHMTRMIHDVNISNKERAEYTNSLHADIAVRIHANGSSNASIRGVETYGPSASNPYVSHLSNASMSLSKCIVDAYAAATGFRNRGARTSDIMTGINWSTVPVTIVELGYMSNAEEDRAMQDAIMQNNMVQGIANGIDAYFGM